MVTDTNLLQVKGLEHDAPIWERVGRGIDERVLLRWPARDFPSAVLIPGDCFRHWNHRDLFEHDALQFLDDRVLLRAGGRGGELVQQSISGCIAPALEVAWRRLADRCTVPAIEDRAKIVVRSWRGEGVI